MIDFNIKNNNIQFIMLNTCNSINFTYFHNQKLKDHNETVKVCKKIRKKYFYFFSNYKLLFLEKLHKKYPKGICFPYSIIGIQDRLFYNKNNDQPGIFKVMRDLTNKKFNLKKKFDKNDKIVITLVKKNKRHSILNHNELFLYLKRKYKNFEINQIDPSKLTFTEEINIISKTRILITP
jgi:hypothetical protein